MKKHPVLSLWATENGDVYGPRGLRSPHFDRYGYLRLSCVKNGKHIKMTVHRIVAETFFGLNDDLTVNHKNNNKLDNRVENLEYVTASENTSHSFKTGARKFCHPVVSEGVLYYSRRELERKTGIKRQ
jgi:hypothetical protein